MSVTIDGVDDVKAALDQLRTTTVDASGEAARREADRVADDERGLVPVLSGDLRDGIEVRQTGDTSFEVGIYDLDLFYGVFIEWGRGGGRVPAQQFATPAAERSRIRFPAAAAQLIRDRIA